MKYKIGIIDDRKEEIRMIKHSLKSDFEVVEIELFTDSGLVFEQIINNELSAVVIDYELTASNPQIHYRGDELISMIRENKKEFPITMLTAFSEQAEGSHVNPDIVYDKNDLYENPDVFIRKLKHKIENYLVKIEKAQEELTELVNQEKLSLKQENKLLELDLMLENEINSKHSIPSELKKSSNAERIDKLIELTRTLIKEVDAKNEEENTQ